MDLLRVKRSLLQYCHDFVDSRLASSKQAMEDAQQAANTEEKSSAGDKYETGRSMMQLEREQAAHQVSEGLKLKKALSGIDPEISVDRATTGSLIVSRHVWIFIAIGIGKATVDGRDYLIIAPDSPLGKILVGKKVGDPFSFNKEDHLITKIS